MRSTIHQLEAAWAECLGSSGPDSWDKAGGIVGYLGICWLGDLMNWLELQVLTIR